LCKDIYSLLISGKSLKILVSLGLKLERINIELPKRKVNKKLKLVSFEDSGFEEETFCFTAEKTNRGTFNGIVAGQCEHNTSFTCYVDNHEWLEVANWVYNNWDYFVGISFLPKDGGIYE